MVSVDFCICGGYKRKVVRCVLCGRVIEDFDEFAPIYECDICRRNPLIKKEELKIGDKNNMIKYKKLKIKNEEEVEKLNINDIEVLNGFGDIRFRDIDAPNSAIVYAFFNTVLRGKAAKLSKKADWIIREYEGELYLIALKKGC